MKLIQYKPPHRDGGPGFYFLPWLGHTYFCRRAFSINEGQTPTIYLRWRDEKGWSFFLYIALTRRVGFCTNGRTVKAA